MGLGRKILPLLGLFFPLLAPAETSAPAPMEKPVEEISFEAIEQPWSIQGLAELPAYSFYLGAPNIQGVSYQPNVNVRLGTRIVWKNFGATIAFPLPIPESERERRGDSSQTSLVLNKYWRQHAADFYFQRFKSFYIASPISEFGRRPDRYPQLPDAKISNLGLTWYYALQPKTYSLKAAFSQTEFQAQSGGSWLRAFFYNRLEVDLGERFLPGSDPNSLNTMPNLAAGRFETLGAGIGYGHTWIRERRFATAQLVAMPALQYQRIQKSQGRDGEHVTWAAKANLNLSGGWNYKKYVLGLKVLIDTQYSKINHTQVWSTLPVGQAFIGGRF